MGILITSAKYAMLFLVSGFAAVILWKMLTGGISLDGLLDDKSGADGGFSAGRLQLLLTTLLVAMKYLSSIIHNPHTGSLPSVPQGWVVASGVSSAAYLGGKTLSRYGQ